MNRFSLNYRWSWKNNKDTSYKNKHIELESGEILPTPKETKTYELICYDEAGDLTEEELQALFDRIDREQSATEAELTALEENTYDFYGESGNTTRPDQYRELTPSEAQTLETLIERYENGTPPMTRFAATERAYRNVLENRQFEDSGGLVLEDQAISIDTLATSEEFEALNLNYMIQLRVAEVALRHVLGTIYQPIAQSRPRQEMKELAIRHIAEAYLRRQAREAHVNTQHRAAYEVEWMVAPNEDACLIRIRSSTRRPGLFRQYSSDHLTNYSISSHETLRDMVERDSSFPFDVIIDQGVNND